MSTLTSPTTTIGTIGNEIALLETASDSPESAPTTPMIVDHAKFEDLRKVVLDLSVSCFLQY